MRVKMMFSMKVMKRIARDFTVFMDVPNNTPISKCMIIIKVETANRLIQKTGFAGRKIEAYVEGTHVQINSGEYYVEGKEK